MIMKKTLSLIAILVSALLFSHPSAVFGIGQMTEPIIIENARQGEVFEETLYLLNTEKTEAVFKIVAENDIADWVKFYDPEDPKTPIEKITISQSSKYNLITAEFSIPEGTPNGEYLGAISVATSSENEESEEKVSTTVGQKIDREVSITVTDKEEIDLNTSVIPKTYNLKTGEPLSIRIIYDNQSNIKVRPQVQVKLKRDGETMHNAIYPFPEELDSVNSFSMKEIIPLEIQTTGLEDGKYLAEMSIIVDEKNKYDNQFSFSVGTAVNEDNNHAFLNFVSRIGGGNITLGYFLVGGFFVALVILIGTTGRKRMFGKFSFKDKKIL
jgi:hypothetical protein